MEFIIFILVLVFVFFNDLKKKDKKPQAARPTAARPTSNTAVPEEEEDLPEPEGLPRMMADPPLEGSTVGDGEGCVGGSMAHDQHEGESRAEHRRHMAAIERREAAEAEAGRAGREASSLNARRLRQAVIMAEVLDRPVALRSNRTRRTSAN